MYIRIEVVCINRYIHNLFIGQLRTVVSSLWIFVFVYLLFLYILGFAFFDIFICFIAYLFFSVFIVICQLLEIKYRKVNINKYEEVVNCLIYKERGLVVDTKEIREFFCKIPIELKEKVLKDNLRIYLITDNGKKVNGYYKISKNSIYIIVRKEKINFKTFLHEFAHYIDYSFGGLSRNIFIRVLLLKFRYSEFKLLKDSMLVVGKYSQNSSLIERINKSRFKQKMSRVIFYFLGYKNKIILNTLPYGLINHIEFFSEIFCESVYLMGKDKIEAIPNEYFLFPLTTYSKFGNVERIKIFFSNLLFVNYIKCKKY